jgi:hypothetical protein
MSLMWLKRIKNGTYTVILVFLILASVIQTLFVWRQDIEGFPFNLFNKNSSSSGEQFVLGNLFRPSAIYIGRGIDQPRYLVNEGRFETAWNDTKRFLTQILTNPKIANSGNFAYSLAEWKKIVSKKGFYITFPFDIEPIFLANLIDCDLINNTIQGGIRAIAILPWDNVNSNMLNIYIRTAYDIYRFPLEIKDLNERKLIYDIILNEQEASGGYEFRYLADVFPTEDFKYDINGTMMILLTSYDKSVIETVNAIGFRNSFGLQNNVSDEGYINEIARIITGSNESNYITSRDSENTVILKNINNIYRYYSEGVLEYNYISGPGAKPEAVYSVMISNVAKQLGSFDPIIDTDKIYLSNIRSGSGTYTFTFDYTFNDKPVAVDMPYSDKTAKNMIQIVSNGLDVISYVVVPIEAYGKEQTNVQSLDFVSLLDNLKTVSGSVGFTFKDYQRVYIAGSFDEDNEVYPKWEIVSFDNTRYYIDIAEK